MAKQRQFDFTSVASPVPVRNSAVRILKQETDPSVLDLDRAKWIPVDIIDPDPDQFRKHFDEVALRDLAQNILAQGVLQPIIVEWISETNRFRVIAGERRRRAVKLARQLQAEDGSLSDRDLSRIPAIVRDASTIDRTIQQVSENESRQDYSDVERAFAYERLKEILDVTWEELGAKLGLSRQRIHQIRSTKNRLAESVRDDIAERRITERQARKLVLLPPPVQEKVAEAIKDNHLTQQQTDTLVQRIRVAVRANPPAPIPATAPENLTEHSGSDEPTRSVPSKGEHAVDGQPWLTQVVAAAVEEVTRSEGPSETTTIDTEVIPSAADVLRWIGERPQGSLRAARTDDERDALINALDELIAWAGELRSRMRGM